MQHTYTITGMTCSSCQAVVEHQIAQVSGVESVSVNLKTGTADIEMTSHIPLETLKSSLKDYPKYQLSEITPAISTDINDTENKSWIATYKPVLLIFIYILSIALITSLSSVGFDRMLFMRIFMSGFFLVFSFFKMLDLKGFADSYAMYDLVAMRFRQWGYIYVFIELGLGLSFALNFQPMTTNLITLLVMSFSLIGVVLSVLNKKKIRCACLGAVFNLPMSAVTIIEDSIMIIMSAAMLASMI